jgi:hypothetical protein
MRRSPLETILFLLCLFCILSAKSQEKVVWDCAVEQLQTFQTKKLPGYEKLRLRSNLELKEYIDRFERNRTAPYFNGRVTGDSNYVIPVVVHVIYPAGEPYGTGANISYAQIRSQIEALNAAFGKEYPTYNGQSHPAYAENTHIRFCLARIAGDQGPWAQGPGGVEYGVRRYPSSSAYDHLITESSANQLYSLTHPSYNFPFEKYLNIWLVKTIDGGNSVMGYAPKPIMQSYPLDGVVMRTDVFGDNTTGGNYPLSFGLMQGKILAHEVGHYLGLYHIFQGGCAGTNQAGSAIDACDLNGDMICDIEPCTTQNIFCGAGEPNTCTANYSTGTTSVDMINDYMSYADDDCMNTFTLNQAQRMWATLNVQRQSLWQTTNLLATGLMGAGACVPPYLNSQILTTNSSFCTNTAVAFSNPHAGNTAVTYSWQFFGGIPSTSTANSQDVTYPVAGTYKAILTVSDGNTIRTDSLLFTVSECKVDSSLLYMSQWYFGDYCSLDFRSGTPVKTNTALNKLTVHGESSYTGQLTYIAATVSVCDSLGNLLFYSNGVSVWNSAHKKITSSPMFGASDINASTGLCYVPYPGHPEKYFIVGAYPNFDGQPSGVRFVMVDVLTDSVTSYKEFSNSILPKRFSEHLTVIPHCNGKDFWIIVKGSGFESDNNFYSFVVTENGIDVAQVPVISFGFVHPAYGGAGDELKSNRAGDKLLLCSPHGYINIESAALYDFNSLTGKVSNERLVPNANGYSNIQTGGAFSSNGEYFYLMRSSNFSTNGPPYWLFQYRVSDLKFNVLSTTGFYFGSAFQLGPDDNIYITNGWDYLGRVSKADSWGGAVYNGEYINFSEPNFLRHNRNSLPSFIDAKRKTPTHPEFTVTTVSCDTYRLSTDCFDDYTPTWSFGDGTQVESAKTVTHNYNRSGEYSVTLTLSKNGVVYGSTTKKINVIPIAANITGPDQVCATTTNPSEYFAPGLPGVDYDWSVTGGRISGSQKASFVDVIWSPTQSKGTLQLKITKDLCSVLASKDVSITKGPSFNWILKDSVCASDSAFRLVASPVGGSFSGPGVKDGFFSPAVAGLGYHQIKYTYFDELTCLGETERTIKVKDCSNVGANTICNEQLSNIQIAPNPITDLLRVKSTYLLKYAQVFNAAGQKVAEGQFINNSFRLPVLANGLYTVLVFCDRNVSFRALVFLKTN